MSKGRLRSAVLFLLVAALAPGRAGATQKFGPLQLSGNMQSQNLFRHPNGGEWQYIQNRNTAHVRLEYDWVQGGKFYGKYSIPFLESSKLFLLWRGVYDSVYDTTPGFAAREDIHGKNYFTGSEFLTYKQYGEQVLGLDPNTFELSGLSKDERDILKFDNQLREAYVDLKFRVIPLTVRAGRQQIVWGETDNFRMLDRANSLDLTWHLQQEIPVPAFGWDSIRRPFWMLKFLYDLGNIGPLSQSFLEWYWNPGDWRPAKQTYLPRPWGLPFMDPLNNPVDGVFGGGVCGPAPGQRCTRLMNDTKLFDRGDWTRNALDNSQVGVRYHGITPQGLEFTLNYYYQRWTGDDGTNYAPLRGLPLPGNKDPVGRAAAERMRDDLVLQGIFPAEFIAPYVHTIGASANYSDETFTQAVLRFETVFDSGVPFFDVGRERVTVVSDPALPGVRKKNMWKGMIAFDRPTWIRWLNKKSTVFLTGQFFWHYLLDNPSCQGQIVAQQPRAERPASCLVGGLDLPSTVRTDPELQFRDKIRTWETLATFAAFTFYRGGSIIPLVGFALDATNSWNLEPFWMVDYVVRDDLVINLAQRYFVQPHGHSTPIFETWGLAGFNAGRSETSLRLTYQF